MSLYLAGYIFSESSELNDFLVDYFDILVVPMINVDAYQSMADSDKKISYLKNLNNDECE